MERAIELELIDEVIDLKSSKNLYLDEEVARSPVEIYSASERYEAERDAILRRLPYSALHVSELDGPGAFVRGDVYGLPVLFTRDKTGKAHAFLNVCRHRGARLVEQENGCQNRFTCPYHAWTYASSGELLSAPHFDKGFAQPDGSNGKDTIALKSLPLVEKFGLIWVVADPGGEFDFDAWFAPMADELEALNMEDMYVAQSEVMTPAANWKIVVEGGIESYHFKVAHRDTVGPYFEDNLSTYRSYGPHMRSILPRTTIGALGDEERESWRVRDHANVLYNLFPTTQLLVQQDHIVWISSQAAAADKTEIRLATIVPNSGPLAEAKNDEHWAFNHKFTAKTLKEDFDLGEGIQEGLASGANDTLLFGRFEGALGAFNRTVEGFLTSS